MHHLSTLGSTLTALLLLNVPHAAQAGHLLVPDDTGPIVDATPALDILRLGTSEGSRTVFEASVSQRRLQQASIFFDLETDLSRARAQGNDALPGVAPRPLLVAYAITNNVAVSASKDAYIRDKLMPALGSFLGRSMRVRRPSGNLDFSRTSRTDVFGRRFPTPEDGIAADIFMTVIVSEPGDELGVCGEGTIAAAAPSAFEEGTGRPIAGFIVICTLQGVLSADLATLAHEMMHALVAHPILVQQYLGLTETPVEVGPNGNEFISTPRVTEEVAEYFNCPNVIGGRSEDGNSAQGIDQGTAGVGHWEQAVFYQDFLQGQASSSSDSFDIARMTDMSLAWLQDSGWYDVKYGSSGAMSIGHDNGCAWATGDAAGVLADPATGAQVCTVDEIQRCNVDACVLPLSGFPFTSSAPYDACLERRPDGCARCLADWSGIGFCRSNPLDSGFVFPRPVPDPEAAFAVATEDIEPTSQLNASVRDCRAMGPNMRCVEEIGASGVAVPACRQMSCTADGDLLINGEPCDPSTANCPDPVKLCQDLGTLTCADRNDCNHRGQCVRGVCYCYIGFGGPACDIEICTDAGCSDGAECPASGFCDVPTCGEWSEGATGKGTPCNLPGDPAADPANVNRNVNPPAGSTGAAAAAAPCSQGQLSLAAAAMLVAAWLW